MDSVDSSASSDKDSWIERFLSLDGHEFLCEVDNEYIQDSFNLYGLRDVTENFKHALKTILDHYDTTASDSDDPDFNNARVLYGLIHQRYILTRRGLDKMFRKYRQGDFGMCPVTTCNDAKMLPIGFADQPNESSVKLFCPSCKNSFHPSRCLDRHTKMAGRMDGAFFGTTFAHLLMMTFRDSFADVEHSPYVPKIFGFKVHSKSPTEIDELYESKGKSSTVSKLSSGGSSRKGSGKSSSKSKSSNSSRNSGDGVKSGKSRSSGRKSPPTNSMQDGAESKRLRTENAKLREKVALMQQQIIKHSASKGQRGKDRIVEMNSGALSNQVEPSAILESRMKRKKYSSTNSRRSTSSSGSKSKRQKHREGR